METFKKISTENTHRTYRKDTFKVISIFWNYFMNNIFVIHAVGCQNMKKTEATILPALRKIHQKHVLSWQRNLNYVKIKQHHDIPEHK